MPGVFCGRPQSRGLFDASIGDRLHGNLKLGLLEKWAQMKLGSAWLVEMTKTQRQRQILMTQIRTIL